MKINSFEDLDIWKKSIIIVKNIYEVTNKNYFKRDYGLVDQMRRSAISITSNISEGFEKNSDLEFKRYLLIAKGSCGELRAQLFISRELNYINIEEYNHLYTLLITMSKQISSLINYLRQ